MVHRIAICSRLRRTANSGRTLLRRCRRHRDGRHCSGHHPALWLPNRQRDPCQRACRDSTHRHAHPRHRDRLSEERGHRVRPRSRSTWAETARSVRPTHLPGLIATNGVQYGDGGAGGTFTGNTVIGSGFGATGAASTAILLSSAANVTIDNNTITGAGTDLGIAVYVQHRTSRSPTTRSAAPRPTSRRTHTGIGI